MSKDPIDGISAFDSILDVDEAKRCLKITYQQGLNMYHGRLFWMEVAAFELGIILWMAL